MCHGTESIWIPLYNIDRVFTHNSSTAHCAHAHYQIIRTSHFHCIAGGNVSLQKPRQHQSVIRYIHFTASSSAFLLSSSPSTFFFIFRLFFFCYSFLSISPSCGRPLLVSLITRYVMRASVIKEVG
jgi:hypothetical protein